MTTENDIIFDNLYDDFRRTMDGEGSLTLIAYMEENNIDYEEINVEGNAQALAHLRLNNLRTVPQIYDHDGKHIGGYTEFRQSL